MKPMLCLHCLLLPGVVLADCPRVAGQEDDRRANAGCLILHEDKVLLITHRWGGKLGVPGGTREADELAQCTAHRETLEETGLAVTVGRRVDYDPQRHGARCRGRHGRNADGVVAVGPHS